MLHCLALSVLVGSCGVLQQFERDLRRFARLERGMLLDNHALYDKNKVNMKKTHTCTDMHVNTHTQTKTPRLRPCV